MEFLELLKSALEFVPSQYSEIAGVITSIFPILLLIVSALTCFYGLKIHKIWAAFLFFSIGFWIGAIGVMLLLPNISLYISIAIGLILGSIAAYFSHTLLRLQLFALNTFLTYTALTSIVEQYFPNSHSVLIGLLGAVIVGIVSVWHMHRITILTTSFNGASTIILVLFDMFAISGYAAVSIGATAVLLVAGVLVQSHSLKHNEIKKTKQAKKSTNKHNTN